MTLPAKPAPPPSLFHRVDDAVYAVERAFVVVAMVAMVLMVFFDVVDRRLEAQESKLAALLSAVGRRVGLRPGAGGAPWVAQILAPLFGAALVTALLWFGVATMRRQKGRSLVPLRFEPLLAIAGAALLFALGWVMLHRPSNQFYALCFVLCAGAASASWLARTPRPLSRVLVAAIGVPVGALAIYAVVPEGYSWSKEMAMILLLWTSFIGASMAAHQGRHIDIDFGKKMFPKRLRGPVTALGHLVTAGFCGLLVVLGAIYVFGDAGLFRLHGRFPDTRIPDWIVAFAIPWAFGMIGLRAAIAARRVIGGDLTAKGSSPTAAAPTLGRRGARTDGEP